jgi:hypothetical protein
MSIFLRLERSPSIVVNYALICASTSAQDARWQCDCNYESARGRVGWRQRNALRNLNSSAVVGCGQCSEGTSVRVTGEQLTSPSIQKYQNSSHSERFCVSGRGGAKSGFGWLRWIKTTGFVYTRGPRTVRRDAVGRQVPVFFVKSTISHTSPTEWLKYNFCSFSF